MRTRDIYRYLNNNEVNCPDVYSNSSYRITGCRTRTNVLCKITERVCFDSHVDIGDLNMNTYKLVVDA